MSASADTARYRVRYEFYGDEYSPVVMLCHSLGTDLSLWDPQIESLSRSFRVLRYDVRGHGGSEVTPGPYTVEQLGLDAVALLDTLRIARVHFCGVSLGGCVGQWLGARAPDRIDRLVLSNTAARFGPPARWNDRVALVRKDGMGAIESVVIEGWFTPAFIAREPEIIDRMRRIIRTNSVDGYVASCAALRDLDHGKLVAEIARPTLVIAGRDDRAAPPGDASWLARHIPNARDIVLPAAHLANVEAATEFSAAIVAFFSSPEA